MTPKDVAGYVAEMGIGEKTSTPHVRYESVMSKTVVRKQNNWMFYWVSVTSDGRIVGQSAATYRTKDEAISMARGYVIAGDDVVDETDLPIPRPSPSNGFDVPE